MLLFPSKFGFHLNLLRIDRFIKSHTTKSSHSTKNCVQKKFSRLRDREEKMAKMKAPQMRYLWIYN